MINNNNVNVRRETTSPSASKINNRRKVSHRSKRDKEPRGQPTLNADSKKIHQAKLQHILNKGGEVSQSNEVSAYGSFMGTFGMNPQASKKELVLDLIDFFDYDGSTSNALRQYKYNPNSFNLLPPEAGALGGPEGNVGKVVSVKVWALPEFQATADGSGPATATKQVLFGVPINNWQFVNTGTPPAPDTQDGYAGTAGQTSTTLTPTSVSDWVVVGQYRVDQLFRDANFGPVYDDFGNQCLFTYSVVDPDDATQSSIPLQMCVEIVVAQTLPVLGNIKAGQVESQNADAWANATTSDVPDTQPAMVSLRRLQNSI